MIHSKKNAAQERHGFRDRSVLQLFLTTALFFWGPILVFAGDRVFIRYPATNQTLEESQRFEIEVLGEPPPRRVEIRLNGELVRARRKPPFHFTVQWNTQFTNTVAVLAYFPDGHQERVERTYRPIVVDEETEIRAFEIWPFLDQPLAEQQPRVKFDGRSYAPQKVAPAEQTAMDVVILLDVSGSMQYTLPHISEPLLQLIADWRKRGFAVRLVAFDQEPRQIDLDDLAAQGSLESLYRAEPHSAVWDSLATASGLFSQSSRRLIFLISDGVDDGSRHTIQTAETFLKKTGAPLVWLNATDKLLGRLTRLTRRTGGFELTLNESPWQALQRRLDYQIQLIVPEVSFPISLEGVKGRLWYPRWREP